MGVNMTCSKRFLIILAILLMSCSEKGSENYERAEAFRIVGKYEEAIGEYKNAIKVNPANSKYYYGLALTYESIDSLDNALINFENAKKLSPDSVKYSSKYNIIKGKILFEDHNYKQALPYLFKTKDQSKDSLIHSSSKMIFNNAENLLNKGNYDKAEDELLYLLINLKLKNEKIYYALSEVYLKKEMFKNRIKYLIKASGQNTDNKSYHYEIGKYYYDNSKYDKAIPEFEKCKSFKNSKELLNISKSRYKRIVLKEVNKYFKKEGRNTLGDWLDARTHIDKAIEIVPNEGKYKDLKYKLDKERLYFYEGNQNVKMIVEDLGTSTRDYDYQSLRRIMVCIKNVSSSYVFHVNPNDFTLVSADRRSFHYDGGTFQAVDLQPGTKTCGELHFPTIAKPLTIIFDDMNAGSIERTFPIR